MPSILNSSVAIMQHMRDIRTVVWKIYRNMPAFFLLARVVWERFKPMWMNIVYVISDQSDWKHSQSYTKQCDTDDGALWLMDVKENDVT